MRTQSIVARLVLLVNVFFISLQALRAQAIGLELYSLRNQFKTDVKGTLAKVKSWNLKEVEGNSTYGLSADSFKILLDENNLKMISVGADFDQLAKHPDSAIDKARFFGAKYVVCTWIPHTGDEFTIEDVKKAVYIFSAAGKLMQEKGLSFCYHPHGFEFSPYEGGTLFDYLVQHTDAKYVNFEMDVYWVKHTGQDPAALLEKYPNRFLLLHLKDRRPGTEGNQTGHADVETNVVLGQGDVNIAAVMKAAKKIGVKYCFIEDESSRSEEQIPESLEYLDRLK